MQYIRCFFNCSCMFRTESVLIERGNVSLSETHAVALLTQTLKKSKIANTSSDSKKLGVTLRTVVFY